MLTIRASILGVYVYTAVECNKEYTKRAIITLHTEYPCSSNVHGYMYMSSGGCIAPAEEGWRRQGHLKRLRSS